METEKKQRDLVDWLQVGVSVYSAYQLRKIANPPIDWAKVSEDIAAAQRAQLEEDVEFDSRNVRSDIEELPDNVYGYCTLEAWEHRMRNDSRSHYRFRMRPCLDLCEARMRWIRKRLNPILAQRAQRTMEVGRAVTLLKFFKHRVLHNAWAQKRALGRLFCTFITLLPVIAFLLLAYVCPDAFTGDQKGAIGLFLVIAFVVLVFSSLFMGDPPMSLQLIELNSRDISTALYVPYVSELFKTLVESGAITQAEADRKTVDNIDAALAIFEQYAAQYKDVGEQFNREEAEYQKALSLRYKTERENKRWGDKLAAEEAMRRQYSGIRTI